MLLSSSLSRAASSLSTPRLAAAGPRRGGVVAVSSMPLPLLSTPLPTTPIHASSRPQLRTRCASSRRATVTARASRGEGHGDRGVTARWCLDARCEFHVSSKHWFFLVDVAAGQKKPHLNPPTFKKKKKKNRFGSKAEAAALLTEWATKIAPRALLEAGKVGGGTTSPPSVRVLSGAVGASESRLEVEVSGLPSLAALEALWEALPREENRAWQERLARHVVDGSTRWEVFYELGVVVGQRGGGDETATRVSSTTFSSPSSSPATTGAPSPSSSSSTSPPSPLLVVSGDEAAAILQADAAAARAAIEKSSANGNGGGANGGGSSSSSSASGRGRPRSLERATAARARAAAAAEAHKKHPSSSSSSPPPSPPPIKISGILGATNSSSSSSGNSSGSSSDGFGGGGGYGGDSDGGGLDTSKLVPGQRLPDGSVVATDWKGDVMIIRPGDRGIAGL